MSVKILNYDKELLISYEGLNRFKDLIAAKTERDIKEFYETFIKQKGYKTDAFKQKMIEDYQNLKNKYANNEDNLNILKFLLEPECEGNLGWEVSVSILKIAESIKDDFEYGFIGKERQIAKIEDLKDFLRFSISNKIGFEWF